MSGEVLNVGMLRAYLTVDTTQHSQGLAQAEARMDSSARKQAAALGKVRQAEAQLDAVRANKKSTTLQIVTAEERLASAQRGVRTAEIQTIAATRELAAAQRSAARAAAEQGAASATASKGVANVGKSSAITAGSLGLMRAGATGAAGGLAAVVVALTAMGAAAGIKRLSQLEDANTALTTMMGNAKDAKTFLAELYSFAKTTPFAFTDIADTATKLMAFGSARADIIPILNAIGDAAAGSGKGAEGFNQIADAIGKIQTLGKIQGDVIQQLAAAGVPALQILANVAGTSAEDMAKAISAGAIDSEEAIQGLVWGMQNGTTGIAGSTAKLGGLMEKVKGNWTGSVDTLKSRITSTLATLMEPAKPHIQAFMDWVGKTFAKLPGVIKTVVSGFKSDGTTGGASAVGGLLGLSPASVASLKGILDNLVGGFRDAKAFVADGLIPSLRQLWSTFGPVLGGLLGAQLVGIGAVFRALGAVLRDVLGPALSKVTGFIAEHQDAFRKLALAVGFVVAPVLTLIGAIVTAWQRSVKFRNVVRTVFANIAEYAGTAVSHMIDAFALLWDAGTKALYGILKAADVALGWMPGIGDKVHDAKVAFEDFRNKSLGELDKLAEQADGAGHAIGRALRSAIDEELTQVNWNKSFAARGGFGGGGDGGATGMTATEQEWRDALGGQAPAQTSKPTIDTTAKAKPKKKKVDPAIAARQRIIDMVGAGFISSLTEGSPTEIAKIVQRLVKQVKIALKGAKGSALVAQLQTERDELMKNSKALADNAKALDAAVKKRDEIANLRQSVRTAGIGSLTQLKHPTEVKNYLAERIAMIKKFGSNIATLSKRGLPKFFIQQLIDDLPASAGLASTLASSSDTDFTAIRDASSALDKASADAGDASATAMYGMGQNAAQGIVDGLRAKKEELKATMRELAHTMVSTLKKELKIKSPSRIGVGIGANFGDSVGGGAVSSVPTVKKAMNRLATPMQNFAPTYTGTRPRGGDGASSPVLSEDQFQRLEAAIERGASRARPQVEHVAVAKAARAGEHQLGRR